MRTDGWSTSVAWVTAPWRRGRGLRQVLVGTAVGAMVISAVIWAIVAGGWAALTWSGVGATTALATVVPKVLSTLFEEIIFRGLMLRALDRWLGSYLALAVSAVVFGAVYLINPDASLVGATGVAVGGGILLGAAYLATRSLWLPIGLHFGWNLFQGPIWGATISGLHHD